MDIKKAVGPLFVFFCFCFGVTGFPAYGQTGVDSTGNGGMHTIQGRIYLPSGRMSDSTITVRLESLNFPAVTLITDRNGTFAFRSLSPGSYTVVIDAGENFMIAKEYFTFEAEVQGPNIRIPPVPKIFNVPIYLQFKANSPLKNEVINAKYASIPKQALQQCQKGLELARAGKTEEALKAYRQAIAIYPQFAVPYTEIGKIYLKAGRIQEALVELVLAVRYDPKDFDTKLNYGAALFATKDFDVAEKELREAVELNKNAVTPHYYLGLLFLERRNPENAQKELETAKQLKGEKELPVVHRHLSGLYFAKGQFRIAADELEIYVRLVPNAKDADQARKVIQDLRNRQN